MILFFSGTGNSKYAARRLAAALNDTLADLFGALRSGEPFTAVSEKPFVIVSPTYAWQLPHAVGDLLKEASLTGSREVYFVMTCGSDTGAAGAYNEKLCREKGLVCKGTATVVMPENYIAMFSAPEKEEALDIVDKAEAVIDEIAARIRKGEPLPESKSAFGKLKSGAVNRFFYKYSIKDGAFTVGSSCVHCGLCEKVCPMGNISVFDGKPTWNGRCTHCMACICRCPKGAIEYGKKSVGKPRYTCPKH